MNEILHANIFFLITSIAVIVVGIGLSIALYYVILILREFREVAEKVRKASDGLEEDFQDLRAGVKSEGRKVKSAFDLALGFILQRFARGKPKKKVKAPKEE
ncbi:hypothetical protein K8Q93_01935 [Candidatus Parcubacteria bacterium]|nr:hypothetical protein [Candidatus Parcubacteria bacterium]